MSLSVVVSFAHPAGASPAPQSLPGLIPYDLRCDDAAQPLGLDDPRPRLSWKLAPGKTRHANGSWTDGARARRQTAYRILAASDLQHLNADHGDLWDSGETRANRLPYAVYAGKPLRSGQRVYWKVRTRDENGVLSPWSAAIDRVGPQTWEMGLLRPGDWQGRWITGGRPQPASEREMYADDPAPLLRKEFAVTKPVAAARIAICGLGYYELHLNGAKVGDHVLDPGWTEYSRRALYATYDVTRQLRQGGNAVGIMLGNGWYNPLPLRMWGHLNLREHLTIGQPRAIAQLMITYTDGTRQTVATDETWRWHDGPILRNSVYLGEVYDARRELPGWDRPGAEQGDWRPAQTATAPIGPLRAQTAPPIRITRTLRPVKVSMLPSGVAIVDMGQNFAGWVRLRVHGPAGARVTLRYGELLRPDGALNPLTSAAGQIKGQAVEPGSEAPTTAWQRDIYTLKGRGEKGKDEEVYTPRFTFHGFRYVEITGFPGVPTVDTLTGLRLNADVEPVGTFSCSDETYNRIQEITRWTEQSNLFSVQSDCPHREKFGYGGDIVAASEMAMLNYDMSRFYAKTVQDYADAARPDGGLTETAPYVGIADAGLGGETGPIEWGIAHPLLLTQLYRYYGNRALIEAQYATAHRWMRRLQTAAQEGILDNGIGDHEGLLRPPTALTGTAFYYANAMLMAQLAEVLGRKADLAEYRALAAQIKSAFQARFDPQQTGRFAEGGESSQAFSLYFGLVPPMERGAALDALVRDVLVTNRGHVDTGIFGTKFMLNALSDAGRADVAAIMVGQQTFPGWGHMLANGATTLWEHWEYSDNTYSHNHPMFGSVSEWIYKSVAGIAPAPDAVGFDRILIRPQFVPGLTWVRGAYRSVRGVIAVEWAQRPDGIHLTVTIPPNTGAQVALPAPAWQAITESGKSIDRAVGITPFHIKDGMPILHIESGTYHFVFRGQRVAKASAFPP
jgi:alpha-L-rhamnosidase